MSATLRIVTDVLLPHDPSILSLTDQIASVDTVDAVSSSLIELDREVQNIKLTFEGDDLDYDRIEEAIQQAGGTVHSVDQVVCGDYIVKEHRTLQDT